MQALRAEMLYFFQENAYRKEVLPSPLPIGEHCNFLIPCCKKKISARLIVHLRHMSVKQAKTKDFCHITFQKTQSTLRISLSTLRGQHHNAPFCPSMPRFVGREVYQAQSFAITFSHNQQAQLSLFVKISRLRGYVLFQCIT